MSVNFTKMSALINMYNKLEIITKIIFRILNLIMSENYYEKNTCKELKIIVITIEHMLNYAKVQSTNICIQMKLQLRHPQFDQFGYRIKSKSIFIVMVIEAVKIFFK